MPVTPTNTIPSVDIIEAFRAGYPPLPPGMDTFRTYRLEEPESTTHHIHKRIIRLEDEVDPNGKALHEPGSKGDAGKIRPSLVLGGFARALIEVCKVGTYGAVKYSDNGWMEVPNGEDRYDDAKLRHWLKEKSGEACDADTELAHAAHEAWNALARLDLMLRKRA